MRYPWATDIRRFEIDGRSSRVAFAVRYFGVLTARGEFRDVSGRIECDGEGEGATAEVTATVGVASVDTGIALRDRHLRSDSYFRVRAYPAATFQAGPVEPRPAGFVLRGALTLCGATDLVNIPVDTIAMSDGDGELRLIAEGGCSLYRSDFGVGTRRPDGRAVPRWDPRRLFIADEVDVTVYIEAVGRRATRAGAH